MAGRVAGVAETVQSKIALGQWQDDAKALRERISEPDLRAAREKAQTLLLMQVGRALEVAGKAVETYDDYSERGKAVVDRVLAGRVSEVEVVRSRGPGEERAGRVCCRDRPEEAPKPGADKPAEAAKPPPPPPSPRSPPPPRRPPPKPKAEDRRHRRQEGDAPPRRQRHRGQEGRRRLSTADQSRLATSPPVAYVEPYDRRASQPQAQKSPSSRRRTAA